MIFKKTNSPPKTKLCEIFMKYGSDKCPQIFHSYSPMYYEILKPYQDKFTHIIEIGVGTKEIMSNIVGQGYQIGASLKSWRDFFPNATIFGLDIDRSVLFEEERIYCYYTDQSKETELVNSINIIRKNFNENLLFDMIIDDGSHVVNHMITSFKCLTKYLKKNGLYIIEDIKSHELELFKIDLPSNMVIEYVHVGESEWDSFIVYKKI